ncbi:MAG: hypothetical protein ACYDCO_00130 [Armatimonadota bacterium]
MIRHRSPFLLLALAAALFLLATAAGAEVKWTNFGLMGDHCGSPVSLDGELAAFNDVYYETWVWGAPTRLGYYDFGKGQKVLTSIALDYWSMPCISGGKIAYDINGEISIYDIATGLATPTGITTASRRYDDEGRYFNGQQIVYVDSGDRRVKLYTVATGQITDIAAGGAPSLGDGIVAFDTYDSTTWTWQVWVYDIASGHLTALGEGWTPHAAGHLVVFADRSTGELKYYHARTGGIVSTGILDVYRYGTDGVQIALEQRGEPILIFDTNRLKLTDTGHYGCSGGDTCWIAVSDKYVAYERWEGGTDIWNPYPQPSTVIYPPTDYNGDGAIQSECVPLWFKL